MSTLVKRPLARSFGANLPTDAPTPGYAFLRGKQDDGSYIVLRAQIAAGVYVNIQGKAA